MIVISVTCEVTLLVGLVFGILAVLLEDLAKPLDVEGQLL
jgi:hypothetical protein